MSAVLVQALFLALIVERLIEYVKAPVLRKWPTLDLWWVLYVAWVLGAVLAWIAGLNLFPDIFPEPISGRLMTAIVVGGGANLIHDIFPDRDVF